MAKINTSLFDINFDEISEIDLITDVENTINALMALKGVNRTELAKRMGVSRVRVHQILKSNRNLTLRTLSQVCKALDERIELVAPALTKRNKVEGQKIRSDKVAQGVKNKSIYTADFRTKIVMKGDEGRPAIHSEFKSSPHKSGQRVSSYVTCG